MERLSFLLKASICTLFFPAPCPQLWGCGPSFPNSLLFQGEKSDLMTLEVVLLTFGYLR